MKSSEPGMPKWRERFSKTSEKRFLGLEIDRKTNVISLVAFFLSAAGIAGQVYFFLQGPRIALQPPEQAVFFGDRAADGKTIYLKIAGRMAYVNTGQPGFNDAIKREMASVVIGKRTLTFFWKKYIASDSDGTQFRMNPKGDALPVAINAGSVEAHETAFSSLPVPTDNNEYGINFIEFSEFEKLAINEKEILVTFSYETFSGSKGSAKCKVLVDRAFRT